MKPKQWRLHPSRFNGPGKYDLQIDDKTALSVVADEHGVFTPPETEFPLYAFANLIGSRRDIAYSGRS